MDSLGACGPPPPEAVYTDIDSAVAAIQAHAQCNGYALFKRDTKPKRIVYACDRYGKTAISRSKEVHESKRREGSSSKKCGCTMKVALKQDKISGHWHLSVLEGTHNHQSSADPAAHPAYRIAALDPEVAAYIRSLSDSGLMPSQILSVVRTQFPSAILVQKDVSNIIQNVRLKQLGGRSPMQWLLEVC